MVEEAGSQQSTDGDRAIEFSKPMMGDDQMAIKKAKKPAAKKPAAAKKAPAKKVAAKKPAAAKKAPAKKAAVKKAPAKKAAAPKKPAAKKVKSTVKRKPNAAFMKPMTPTPALAAVIGATPQPRTEVTKKIWAYIKKNGLQDAKNKRMINADDKLGEVFGSKKQVSMFEMTKLVNKHLK
jgi:chromatin remodeling complex protein RSC6